MTRHNATTPRSRCPCAPGPIMTTYPTPEPTERNECNMTTDQKVSSTPPDDPLSHRSDRVARIVCALLMDDDAELRRLGVDR